MCKRSDPFQEDEQHLHSITMRFWHEAANEMKDLFPVIIVFDSCRIIISHTTNKRWLSVLCVASQRCCSLKVSSGSGRSRKNFFRRAAIWTGLSSNRLTDSASRSMISVSSFKRRILPFFRKMPSIDMSGCKCK